VPGVPENPAVDGGVSQTTFANYTNIGSPDFLPKRQIPQQFQWIDNVSLAVGKHLLKFGVDIQGPMRNIFQDEPGTRGSLGFDKIFTCQRGSNGQCTGNTGISYADALLGYVKSAQLTNVFFVDQRLKMFGGFAQDDWRITPRLTLNLGLRYDFSAPAVDGQNRMANFNPAANGGAGGLVFATSGSIQNRSLVQPNTKNFGPRVGFAWSMDNKTVLRGGFGMFYSLFERVGSENQLALNPPSLVNNTPSVPSNATAPVFFLQNGFPANFLNPNNLNLQLVHLRAENPYFPTPTVDQWSFGVQHEFSGGMVAEVDYVGTKSTHLDVLSDLNQPVNAAGTGVTSALPYPNFGYIEYSSAIANGIYNGLEASLVRRLQKGLEVRATYTYSRSIDNVSQELEAGSGNAQNGLNYHAWRGPSDFDIPHRLTLYYIYELPAGRGHQMFSHGLASYILGNWRTSGFYSFAAGRPITVSAGSSLGSSIDPYSAATAVPNVIGTPHIVGDPNCWYYASVNPFCKALAPNLTDAFQLQQPGQFGNAGRNILRGPLISTFSFNILKEKPLRERVNMEFRWEVFNLTNTPIFAQPSNNFSSGSAGQITSLAGDPRVMQFALRLSF
jgi:hypothetical protein